jgi:hypothetical protein
MSETLKSLRVTKIVFTSVIDVPFDLPHNILRFPHLLYCTRSEMGRPSALCQNVAICRHFVKLLYVTPRDRPSTALGLYGVMHRDAKQCLLTAPSMPSIL